VTETVIYLHKRVSFGVTCSPFLLGAVIEHHLLHVQFPDSFVASKLWKSLYVDNCVTSFDTYIEYEDLKKSAIRIMDDAKMEFKIKESRATVGVMGVWIRRFYSECFIGNSSFGHEMAQRYRHIVM